MVCVFRFFGVKSWAWSMCVIYQMKAGKMRYTVYYVNVGLEFVFVRN